MKDQWRCLRSAEGKIPHFIIFSKISSLILRVVFREVRDDIVRLIHFDIALGVDEVGDLALAAASDELGRDRIVSDILLFKGDAELFARGEHLMAEWASSFYI